MREGPRLPEFCLTLLPDCDLIWLVTVPRPFLVTLVLLLTTPEELD